MSWEPIDLKEERRHHPLDLTGLVGVRPFLRDRVELIEEEDASARASELEHGIEPRCGLTEEAGDDALIPHYVEGEHRLGGDRLSQAGLPVSGWPVEKDAVSRLKPVAAEEIRATVLLDHLIDGSAHGGPQVEGCERTRRHDPLGDQGHRRVIEHRVRLSHDAPPKLRTSASSGRLDHRTSTSCLRRVPVAGDLLPLPWRLPMRRSVRCQPANRSSS